MRTLGLLLVFILLLLACSGDGNGVEEDGLPFTYPAFIYFYTDG